MISFLVAFFLGVLAVNTAFVWATCGDEPAARKTPWTLFPARLVPSLVGGIAACALLVWEVEWQMLTPQMSLGTESPTVLALRFGLHLVLLTALLAATLTDFRAMIIPDAITIPGTLLGLAILAGMPGLALPVRNEHRVESETAIPMFVAEAGVLHYASPNDARTASRSPTLAVALQLVWWTAIVALLDRPWYARLGLRRATILLLRVVHRSRRTPILLGLGAMGSLVLGVATTFFGETPSTLALASSLMGMAVGAGMIWAVRIVGTLAMRREAMGFGDVTLMGMIGAFLGWQPCLAIFFLAPFAGLAFAVARSLARSERELPYGPFLCAATLFTLVFWRHVWGQIEPLVSLGAVLPLTLLICLVLMGLMLWLWRRLFEV